LLTSHYTGATRILGDAAGQIVAAPGVDRDTVLRCRSAHNGVFDHIGAVAGLAFCAVHVVQATELIALDVFNSGARQITLGDVEHYLGHSPECRCGRCQAAAIVRPDRVLMVVRAWQRQMRATRVRALR
jgi:hypothetical protein